MMKNVIWESEDDKGRYYARVTRTGDRTADLELEDLQLGIVLRRKQVSLMFGALFGPDVEDVRSWNQQCTVWSDELDTERGIS